MSINKILNEEREGFSGINHLLIAIMLFLILLLIPVPPFSDFLQQMMTSPLTGIMAFLLIMGGALLPDIDNSKNDGGSMASWSLGFIGSILSSIMITISSIATSIFRTKKDMKPQTQHRFFWHTFLIPVLMFLLIQFGIQGGTQSLSTSGITWDSTGYIIITFLVSICIYLGAISLLKKLFKYLPLNNRTANIISLGFMLLSIIICYISSYNDLKLFGLCVTMGYAFHLIGDMFADSGIPALFPIPIGLLFGKGLWMRISLLGPFSITTGSTMESMLKFVFLSIDIILFLAVFFGVGIFSDISNTLASM